ncbi:MAG: hypothetical protein FWE74_01885 [Oscillospiraceae bacterium]|nr:hypothetical protein [Oscillospiraceae bacterium]
MKKGLNENKFKNKIKLNRGKRCFYSAFVNKGLNENKFENKIKLNRGKRCFIPLL